MHKRIYEKRLHVCRRFFYHYFNYVLTLPLRKPLKCKQEVNNMEYTIRQLANLSGVSTRTLRYYDEIDLLKPKRIGENGYRIYETEQIDMLEQILCYRALGVSLEEISRLLSATNTEKEQVLQRHLIALSERKSQIEFFIENVSKTILLLKGDIIMTDEEKFKVMKQTLLSETEQKYGDELRQSYGKAMMMDANKRLSDMNRETWILQETLEKEIRLLLENAVKTKNPNCEQAQKACDLHRQWLCLFWPEGIYSKTAHKALGDSYVSDSRFKAYYDQLGENCANFFRDAIDIYCSK